MKSKYSIEDVEIGNQVSFKRNGIDDFNMNWTVIDFLNGMIKVKINEMSFNDELFIDVSDITYLHKVQDYRFTKNNQLHKI